MPLPLKPPSQHRRSGRLIAGIRCGALPPVLSSREAVPRVAVRGGLPAFLVPRGRIGLPSYIDWGLSVIVVARGRTGLARLLPVRHLDEVATRLLAIAGVRGEDTRLPIEVTR